MHSPDFEIVDRTCQSLPVLVVRGRIGLAEAWTLEGRLLSLFERTSVLVLDLSAVDEVSGGLVGAVLRTRRHIAFSGGTLALVVSGPPVSTIISTSVLQGLVDVAPDVPTAIALLEDRLPSGAITHRRSGSDRRFGKGDRLA